MSIAMPSRKAEAWAMYLAHVDVDPLVAAIGDGSPADPVACYAAQTRALLGVPEDFAFAFNSTAAAVVAVVLKRRGVVPPESDFWQPSPDEPAEVTLLSDTGRLLARITFDVPGAASARDIDRWLDRAQAGHRLFNFGLEVFTSGREGREVARGVAAHLWDTFVAA
jgi:hypothetical protein